MLLYYLSLIENQEDRDKATALYLEYRDLMLHIARQILKKEELAEDATHDAMIQLIQHLDRIDEVESNETKAFIYVVTKNISISLLRKELRQAAEDIDIYLPKLKATDDVFEQAYLKILVEKLLALPGELRDPLELSLYYGLSSKQIGKLLGIGESLVRKRIMQARVQLRLEKEEAAYHED